MSTSQQPPLRVAVVGGGIAGLSAAIGFVHAQEAGANIEIKIYESASRFGEIGAGVSFGPNAQRALRLMGAGAALDKAAGTDNDDPETWFDFHIADAAHAHSGEYICTVSSPRSEPHLPLTFAATGQEPHCARYGHRSERQPASVCTSPPHSTFRR